MRIKRLELVGFKSFLDKTIFSFDVPVTAIVGPNGCGKSNVVDALKWVTGELSYKELRGKTMEDLIFAGSELRPPTSMMEVRLSLDNEMKLAPSQFEAFSEIDVLRRIYRDGSSEFFINKTSCRLRDIVDLFLDTGIGQSSYSIIEQGRVGAIVSSRPEDRRLIIEEAAGITKFKVRKKEALRKIDHTRQNILRVSDILKELSRQISSLERQAKKAEAYKETKLRLKEIDLSLLSQEYLKQSEVLKSLQLEQDVLNESMTQEDSELLAKENAYELNKIEVLNVEKKLEEAQELLFGHRSKVQNLESELKLANQRIAELNQLSQEDLQNSVDLGKKNEELSAALKVLAESIENLESEKNKVLSTLENSEEKEKSHRKHLSQLEEALEQERKSIADISGQELQLRNKFESRQHSLRDLNDKIEETSEKEKILFQQIQELSAQKEDKQKRFEQSNQLFLSFEQDKSKAELSLEKITAEKEEKTDKLVALGRTIEGQKSRLDTLNEFIQTYQGFDEGIRQLMSARKQGDNEKLKNIVDIFGNLISVEPGYERAVQAALHEFINCLVVDQSSDAFSAIDYLKNDLKEGRGSFIVQQDAQFREEKSDQSNNGFRSLAEFVSAKGKLSEPLNNLISNVFLVANLEEGMELWKQGKKFAYVTQEGDRISASGVISGGNWDEKSGVLEIRNQAESLEKTVIKEQSEYRKLEANVDFLAEEIAELKDRIQNLSQDLNRHAEEKISFEKEFLSLNESEKYMQEKKQTLQSELLVFAEQKKVLETEQKSFESQLKAVQEQLSDQEKKKNEANENLLQAREAYAKHAQELTEIKVSQASIVERYDSFVREKDLKSQQIVDTGEEKEKLEERAKERKENANKLGKDIKDLDHKRNEAIKELQESEARVTEVRTNYDEQKESLLEEESRLKKLRAGKEDLSQKINQLRMNIQETEHQARRCVEQCFERYEEDLKQMVASDEVTDMDEETAELLKKDLSKLQDKLNKIGNVHLGAVEELKELQERHDFMQAQYDDLDQSLKSLTEAIKKIDANTMERFVSTFEKVNGVFQELFPKLFNGGKAKLIMTQPENVLETGIDIVAQPPGKKLQNMNLMSGGEKALTAIALIFSIFQFNAPPFCILDEVDAPLDDANVGRFLSMVKEMSDRTQFIMITHNKISMEVADNLFGVTMEEPGISRVVSVKVNETVDEIHQQNQNAQVA